MTAFNLRGLKPDVMSMLKQESKEKETSVNLLILQFVEQGLGYSTKTKPTKYYDLDSLAGTWSEKDAKRFEEDTQYFEHVDKELWK